MTPGDGSKDRASILDPNEPITLSDPDGAITRVAPWSTWTREQVRAPGGAPSLVTHLQDGQLWFAAGRAGSPWNHEIRVGDVSVSTPQGRFHVTVAESGGVTVSCLAGRTRIQPKGGEPTVIRENETAAVSSDGTDVVVTKEDVVTDDESAAVAAAAAAPGGAGDGTEGALLPVHVPRRRGNLVGIARVAAVVAIIAVAAAALALLLRDDPGGDGQISAPIETSPPAEPATTTSDVPSTTEETTTTEESATTEAPSTTDAPSTTQAPPVTVPTVRSSPDARAVGTLVGCRRSGSGVVATVDVRHTSGGAGRFLVEIGVVDASGRSIATGRATSGLIADGQVVPVQVEVAAEGIVNGACELVSVDPV
ncbi:MAG: hypothetical protein KF906_11265 [Actinobacteria bacterium]|nr:hypothetical protein [Actinomycetota bacterium]